MPSTSGSGTAYAGGASFVMNSGDLVGRTPRHPIRPGEPIRPTDIQVPILIHKGDLVTIVLQTPTLTLTAQAKALDDGVLGGPIRVTNTRSGRVLDAVVMNRPYHHALAARLPEYFDDPVAISRKRAA